MLDDGYHLISRGAGQEEAMPFTRLTRSQNLQIFRYENVDQFSQGLRGADVDFVPLGKTDAPVGQAILSLPGCDVYLFRTFPRIVHALLRGRGAFIMLAMEDISATFNGREVESPSLLFARGPLEYRAVERVAGFHAAIVFSSAMEMRGWPETHGAFLAVRIGREAERMLRDLILSQFETVSQRPDFMTTAARSGLENSLLDALDLVFEGWQVDKLAKHEGLRDGVRTLKAIDDLIDSRLSKPIYLGSVSDQPDDAIERKELASVSSLAAAMDRSAATAEGRPAGSGQGRGPEQWFLAPQRFRVEIFCGVRRTSLGDPGAGSRTSLADRFPSSIVSARNNDDRSQGRFH
jgi:AraC family ethanolamine operon transcriptional activator